jgi:hypothetical protein
MIAGETSHYSVMAFLEQEVAGANQVTPICATYCPESTCPSFHSYCLP